MVGCHRVVIIPHSTYHYLGIHAYGLMKHSKRKVVRHVDMCTTKLQQSHANVRGNTVPCRGCSEEPRPQKPHPLGQSRNTCNECDVANRLPYMLVLHIRRQTNHNNIFIINVLYKGSMLMMKV